TALLPGWRELGAPLGVPVTSDSFTYLTASGGVSFPTFALPPNMHNHGNFIVSLGEVCQWLGTQAEAMGIDIFPGFAATELLHDDNGVVKGVATGDMGVN